MEWWQSFGVVARSVRIQHRCGRRSQYAGTDELAGLAPYHQLDDPIALVLCRRRQVKPALDS
jgi:hypothetical protein